jgi:phosphoserine phosphatase RsbU/P
MSIQNQVKQMPSTTTSGFGARLAWNEHHGNPETFPVSANGTLIGRLSDADIVLRNRGISRHHARIVREGEAFVVVDLQSKQGTFVNGQRIDRQQLHAHDRIRFGETGVELLFDTDDPLESTGNLTLWKEAGVARSIRRLATVLPTESGDHSELEKISRLLDFHYSFGKAFSAEKTFRHILKSALQISGAERGFVLRQQGGAFVYAAGFDAWGKSLGQSDFRTSGSVVERVARTGQPVFMTSGIQGDLATSKSVMSMNLRAVACLPLETTSQEGDGPAIMGILYLDSRKNMHALSGMDEKLLTRLAGEAGHVIEKLEMVVALEERKRIDQELSVAKETQRTLLPQSLPHFEPFGIRAFCRATGQLGGDFYDFLPVKDGHLTGVLADVSGKGIPAALLSSLTLGALNMEFRSSPRPDLVLNGVNKMLCEKTPENKFVTLFLFQLDALGKGRFISAGHNSAYLFRSATGEIEELPSGGLPLGMFSSAVYDAIPLELSRGDILVVYSDGLTDAENGAGDVFGEDKLRALIRSSAGEGAQAVESRLLSELHQFTRGANQTDDITFLIIENRGQSGGAHRPYRFSQQTHNAPPWRPMSNKSTTEKSSGPDEPAVRRSCRRRAAFAAG